MQESKYLIANFRDTQWGLTVSTVGYEHIIPGEDYPTHGHADGYYFKVERGRILNEYQLLYITAGEGVFKSSSVEERRIKAGDFFLLFPGEWHTYHPSKNIGWQSYWIGFKGENMDARVKNGFLSPTKPVYHVGYMDRLEDLYHYALDTAQEEAVHTQRTLAGVVNLLIGMMYSLERNIELGKNQEHVNMVNRARKRIRGALEENLTIQQIATDMGVSYSNFRKLFKEFTGVSPALYQQELRLQRAKELLSTTNLSVKQIAYKLCFDSPDYFSAKFKAKINLRPNEFREQTK